MRRYLGFTVDEWDSLPWWQQHMYANELSADVGGEVTAEFDAAPDDPASSEELADLGFNVEG